MPEAPSAGATVNGGAEPEVAPAAPPDPAAELLASLQEKLGEAVQALPTPFDIPQFRVAPSSLLAACELLRKQGFTMLLDLGGVDYHPARPRFEVVYHLQDLKRLRRLRLRVPVDEGEAVPTVSHLWPMAEPAEREVYDLFGVPFAGHPNLTRILMPDDWEGHPLRKDYPLQGPRALQQQVPAGERWEFRTARDVPTKGRGRVD